MTDEYNLTAKKPSFAQNKLYCPYHSRNNLLLYIYIDDRLMGLGLSIILYCPKCKRKYDKGTHGFRETSLEHEIKII